DRLRHHQPARRPSKPRPPGRLDPRPLGHRGAAPPRRHHLRRRRRPAPPHPPPPAGPTGSEATGASGRCPTSATPPSPKTPPRPAPATPPGPWPACATSPSASCTPARTATSTPTCPPTPATPPEGVPSLASPAHEPDTPHVAEALIKLSRRSCGPCPPGIEVPDRPERLFRLPRQVRIGRPRGARIPWRVREGGGEITQAVAVACHQAVTGHVEVVPGGVAGGGGGGHEGGGA